MKKPWIILLCCFLLAAVMCLSVSWPRNPSQTTQPSGTPTVPTGSAGSSTNGAEPSREAAVRLYACDLEDRESLEELALQYEELTGISCRILTGNLEALMEGDEAPTIFCVHSQQEVEQWADRMLDLTGSAVLEMLVSPEFALTIEGKPLGVALDAECYGLIYNAALLARAGYTRSDITDFTSLQTITEYITRDRKVLGFHAFCQANLEDTVLARYLAGLSNDPADIRLFFDSYLANATVQGDPLEQFVAGKTVFYVGGVWEYEQIAALGLSNLDILPLYTPGGGSFHCFDAVYWCVNAGALEEDIAAGLDFLNWLVRAGENGSAPADRLDALLPFTGVKGAGTAFERLLKKHIAAEPVRLRWEIAEGMTAEELSDLTLALSRYADQATDENWEAVASLLQ